MLTVWDVAISSSTVHSVKVSFWESMNEFECENQMIEGIGYAQLMSLFLDQEPKTLLSNQVVSSHKGEMVVLKGSFDGWAALQLL